MNKKCIQSICFLTLGMLLLGCDSATNQGSSNVPVEKSDSSMTEYIQHYQVYIPSIPAKCNKLPVLIIIDPQADVKSAMSHFITGAEKYKFILVASSSIKNNYPGFAHALNLLIDDVKSKYPAGDNLFLAGLSGGGRMVLNYGEFMPVDGIIACGALSSADHIVAIKSPVIAFASLADFNFIESAQYIFKPESAPENLKLELTALSHEWPSAQLLENALGYFNANDKKMKSCSEIKKSRTKDFLKYQKNRIDSLQQCGDILFADMIARNLSTSDNIQKPKEFIQIKENIEASAEYQAALNQLKESIRFELAVRNAYNSALQVNDSIWWVGEINSLLRKMDEDKDYFRSMAYKRIKGFLGIMCFTLSSNAVQLNDLDNADRLLSIYHLIEPQNCDMYYFRALYYQKKEKPDIALNYLKRAIESGYSDFSKIENDFTQQIVIEIKPLLKN